MRYWMKAPGLILFFALWQTKGIAQTPGEKKTVNLEFVRMDKAGEHVFFIDLATKDTIVYDIPFMERSRPDDYEKAKKEIQTIYLFFIKADFDRGFEGQKYTAQLTYSEVQVTVHLPGGESSLQVKKNKWLITSLERNKTNNKPALVYVNHSALESFFKIYLVIGSSLFEVGFLEHVRMQRWEGGSLDELRAIATTFTGETTTYRLTQEYNSETATEYYKLRTVTRKSDEITTVTIDEYDLNGDYIEDRFNKNFSKAATVKYLNDKLSEIKGLKVGSENDVIAEVNSISMKDGFIMHTRDWGENPGYKNCSPNKYEYLFHSFYKFSAADIKEIKPGGDEEKKASGYFRITFNTGSATKYSYDFSCEKEGNRYNWVQSETEKENLNSIAVYFLKSNPDEFERIKTALFHLRDLYKAGSK